MPNVAGVDTALLSKVNLSIEQSWSESQAQIETKDLQAETLKMLNEKQKPLGQNFVQKITDPEKDYDVKVYWPDFSGLEAADGTIDVCNALTGDQAPVREKQYVIQSHVETKVVVEDDKLADATLDKAEYLQQSHDDAIKRLLEKLNQKGIAFLNANAGYNHGVLYNYNAGATEVPAADYNVALMPKIMQDMIYSRIPNGFLIDGGPMHLPYVNAKLDAGNGEGKGDSARTQLFDARFDLLGFAKATLADSSFLVAPGAYALVGKNFVPNRVPVYDEALGGGTGMFKYHQPIPMFGLNADVFYQRICVDGNKNRFKHVWLYKLWYEWLINPSGFEDAEDNVVTGILKYKKLPA